MKKADCAKHEDETDQEGCRELFTDVAECRTDGDKTCEEEALATYQEDYAE